jgi:hypothetical protein
VRKLKRIRPIGNILVAVFLLIIGAIITPVIVKNYLSLTLFYKLLFLFVAIIFIISIFSELTLYYVYDKTHLEIRHFLFIRIMIPLTSVRNISYLYMGIYQLSCESKTYLLFALLNKKTMRELGEFIEKQKHVFEK